MVDDRRLFNDMARVASGAAGAFGGVKSRLEGEVRDRVERLLSRMNLVTREEYDVVAAMARAARTEQEQLADRVAVLEASLAALQPKPRAGGGKSVEPDQTPAGRSAAGRRRAKS
jgi:BMFP domain-containing protein YqiC